MAVIPEGHAIKCRSAQALKVSLDWSALDIVDAQEILRGDPLASEGNARDQHTGCLDGTETQADLEFLVHSRGK